MDNKHPSRSLYSDFQIMEIMETDKCLAFKILFEKYRESLLHFTTRIMKNPVEAEEVLQEILMKLYGTGIQLREKEKLYAYLKTCIRNKIINQYRKNEVYRRHLKIQEYEIARIHDPVTSISDLSDIQHYLSTVLTKLTPNCRTVFTLSRKNQYSNKEISQMLQKPYSTIEKQLRQALTIVKKEFQSHPDYARMI